jgi:hypothetical protein
MTILTYRKINGQYTIDKVQGSRGKYGIDLTDWLTQMGTTAVSVTVTGVGVTVETPGTVTGNIAWAWVSGGSLVDGAQNYVTLTITMADTSIEVRTLYFWISAR